MEDVVGGCEDVEDGVGSGGAWAGEGFGGEGEEREVVEEAADGGRGGKPAVGGHDDGWWFGWLGWDLRLGTFFLEVFGRKIGTPLKLGPLSPIGVTEAEDSGCYQSTSLN